MATKRATKLHTFTARIERLYRGVAQYGFTLPLAVSKALGKRGNVPIVVSVNAVAGVRGTATPCGGGRHRMLLNAKTRTRAGVGVGDRVRITLRIDETPPVEPTPADLAYALRDDDCVADWERFARGKRNHIIQWIEDAAMETTREKRIALTVRLALAAREKRIDREIETARKQRGPEP